jgi:DHA2 family multidrug resistance protein
MSVPAATAPGGPARLPSAPSAPPAAAPPVAAGAPPPLTGSALVLGTIALSLATFMNVLDTSIANVSIPAISGDLGVSPSQGTWVITSFAVANAISVPLTGWLTQRFGPVRLFVMSILLFVVASAVRGAEHRHDRFPRAQASSPGGDPAADAARELSAAKSAQRWRCGR